VHAAGALLLAGWAPPVWALAVFFYGAFDSFRFVAAGIVSRSFGSVPPVWGYAVFDASMGLPMAGGALFGGALYREAFGLPFVVVIGLGIVLLAVLAFFWPHMALRSAFLITIVASGAVKVVVPSDDGDEAILATIRRGDFLGELALLDGAPRSASAIALEATETLALPRVRFSALVAAEPAIRDALLDVALQNQVPLVVPEVNPHHLRQFTKRGIIANPNCSTIQMVVALKPLHDAAGVERVVVSTYQSVSGSGRRGFDELERQARAWAQGDDSEPAFYARRIAFNLLPHIDGFLNDGSTKEEQKMVDETIKIFADPRIKVTATCVRVAVFGAHSESVNVQTREPLGAAAARELLAAAPGIEVVDDPQHALYPTPLDAEGNDPVYVGRIRDDDTAPNCLNFWVVADNLRKGAALNAVQIAEALVARSLL